MSAPLSVCLTFDFDAMSLWIGSFGADDVTAMSRGEFGAVAVPRILDLLERHGVAATFFVPGHTAFAFPGLVREVRDRGHELGHHGWVHESPAEVEPGRQAEVLERGLEALAEVAEVRPRGYRAPDLELSVETIELLLERRFEYDSSCMGADFRPYYLRRGDRWPRDAPYVFGQACELVELPVAWHLDDFPAFEYAPPFSVGPAPASAVLETWWGELEFACAECPGGVLTLTLHPQTIGRGYRLRMLERFIAGASEREDVRFESLGACAARWRAENPLSG